MKRPEIKKILIPVDFSSTSELAMTEAITLAQALKAELFLIHVVEESGYYFSIVPETQAILPSLLELERAVEKRMDEMQRTIKEKHGVMPEVYVTNGQVHSEIISFSEKKKVDLIVMGTHGISGFKELFMGSNSQRVVTLSEIPVLTMQRESKTPKFKNILVPIDNSLHSREKVNVAMIIAGLFQATIHLIGLPRSNDAREREEIEIKLKSVEKIISYDKLSFKTGIVQGKSLAEAAMTYAGENLCDLIVINTGHESAITGIFPGAFAQQIVNHSKTPVLSCKHAEGHFSIDTPWVGIS